VFESPAVNGSQRVRFELLPRAPTLTIVTKPQRGTTMSDDDPRSAWSAKDALSPAVNLAWIAAVWVVVYGAIALHGLSVPYPQRLATALMREDEMNASHWASAVRPLLTSVSTLPEQRAPDQNR
jgi:hypothetical protein